MSALHGLSVQMADTYWNHMGGWGWGMAFFGILLMVLLVVLIAWLVTAARPGPQPAAGRSALELLDARYARGEIDRDEYLARKQDLEA